MNTLQEADLRRLLDSLPGVVLGLDPASRVVFVTSGLTRFLGWNPDDILGLHIGRTLSPEMKPRSGIGSGGQPTPRPSCTLTLRDGSRKLFEIERLPVPAGADGIHQFLLIQPAPPAPPSPADSRLGWDAANLPAFLDLLPVGVLSFDERGRCVGGNRAAREKLVGPGGILEGATAERLLEPSPPIAKSVRRCLETRKSFIESSVPWTRAGRTTYLDWRVDPLGRGGPSSTSRDVLVVVVDATQRTLAEQALKKTANAAEQASRRKTQFLSAIGHDLRTPVNALSLQTELLQQLLDLPTPSKFEIDDLVVDMSKVVSGLDELLSDLLDLSRFDAGYIDDRPTVFAVEEWLGNCLAPFEANANTKGIDFTWRTSAPYPHLRADRVNLTRVLQNLVSNAVKFTEKGSVDVKVRCTSEGGLAIRVTDTGPGIPAEKLDLVFDEFAQLRNPERDRSKGTGLGLAICRRLVEGVGGRITVESRLGVGTLFAARYPPSAITFVPPPSVPQPVTPPPLDKSPPRLHNVAILLADDETGTRASLTHFLEHAGFVVATAQNGPDGLALLNAFHPRVLLLDQMLPGVEGGVGEFLRRLRREHRWQDLPIIIIPGDDSASGTADFVGLDLDAVIPKPVDVNQLLATIGRLCSNVQGHDSSIRLGRSLRA